MYLICGMSRASSYSIRGMNAADVVYPFLRQVDKLVRNTKHAAARENLSVKGEDESIDGELLQRGASLEILISKLHPDMKFYNFNLGYDLTIY
ncbi:hypothetical protein Bca52824_036033 [Brassica carinata]|uniref:Uncharacterized protein n=1 Tax=Brassica carinata TaxID=52824 RepID=A0A8X7S4S1_BRACI|nr:hypothetical protein Bca52824_036033 [Brassica carinata]